MEHPRPVLPSQRYSPSPVYSYDSRRCTPTGRQPLRESTGNVQPGSHLGSLASSCRNSPLSLFSPSLTSMPTPPVVPSQAGSTYRGVGSTLRRPDNSLLARRGRHDINPIYYASEFRPYRDKQDQKDPNEKQIWPRVLEDAFLDSLLIIPHMGRKKYSMQGKQFGRNMLISEYLWIAYCCSLQPGQKAEERKRKQVSSHIQVVKKMFEKHRCYHFFFVKDPDKSEARLKDNMEMPSFKDNPVLIALSEGRLPDVRPNYEYFSQILAMDSLIVMRPKTCWIFVASPHVRMEENGEAYSQDGKLLDHEYYPHLEKNLQKEDGMARGLNGSVLLHEYNREIAQKESSAVTELAQEWEAKFPPLSKSLDFAIQDNKWLDILEMTVTLEIHPRSNFPFGSELNGFVELNISQPPLQNHRWKCITKLARPEELRRGDNEPSVIEQTSEVGVQWTHRPGCQDSKFDCDCRSRPRQDVRVPFPAAEWASILSTCAGYLEPAESKTKIEDEEERIKTAEEAAVEAERFTAELIQQVGMFQELWSSPHDNNGDRRVWTRRGIILWKFRTIHAFDDKWNPIYEKPAAQKGRKPAEDDSDEGTAPSRRGGRPKRVFNPPGTTWRFLTALDPVSQAHQQNVCVNPAAAPARDMLMAPTPPYSHHLAAVMNDNLTSAWDSVTMPGQLPSLASTGTLGLMDSFSHGLATPPPTASIHSSYASSYDGSHELASGSHHQLDFLGTTSMGSQSTLVTDMAPTPADPFLSATGGIQVSNGVNVGVYDDADCEGISEWDATTSSFHGLGHWNGWTESDAKTQQWQSENQRSTAANSSLWAEGHKDPQQPWNQQPWAQAVSAVAAVAGSDGRTGWSPVDQQRPLPSLDQISPLKSTTGSRKRARSNSLDMENRENFPATAIQKLVHHHQAPAAVMEEGGSHGHRSWD
ncbi:Conidiophore development regulator abaA [Colletotrichum sidae]|uniref:Conidiophore development regulator abaA n=1 Tax=Colletotrichum sidae TaxID=1347389 RepID=A0A4R8TTM2_9PEZI|nr:Conidiophore development regulator abaA [Colletotrichum sidae]